MKKRHKKSTFRGTKHPRPDSRDTFNAPFAGLADLLAQIQNDPQHASNGDKNEDVLGKDFVPPAQLKSDSESKKEDTIFQEAMHGVKPLDYNQVQTRAPGPLAKPCRRPLLEGELEAYAQLVDLVSGEGSFNIQHTDEYMEGALFGADPEILPKLRRGDFSIQGYLDLHGMTTAEARYEVERFILSSVMQGLRCVLVIHGRGLNSRDQIPILKERMSSWLKRGRLKHLVLAFATAQPCDGGAGAMYVLLRKRLPERI
jgi:DNA-nicking Smr family endonuclease